MNAAVEYMRPLSDVVVTHVAFRCGCVRTLSDGDTMLANCPIHKENMVSFTEEKAAQAEARKARLPSPYPRWQGQ